MSSFNQTIAVAYLARGADKDWLQSCERFFDSYMRNQSGVKHSLYVIFKGFMSDTGVVKAKALFNSTPYKPIYLDGDSLDIGAYIEWASMIDEDLICAFNTASEILAPDWLSKLTINLGLPNVGLVGATASYESSSELNSTFPPFPNVHIRSTAFMIDRKLFLNITEGLKIDSKVDAYHFESGRESLTRKVLVTGKEILLVGRNGRGYSPQSWAASDIYRQGAQNNLLIADDQTRNFSACPWNEKREFVVKTWGKYIENNRLLRV
ncbi:MAG: hypothetical protein GY814_13815 [Gammaproteobacteria bacterium]|nr:hypothetical protein [Gammaproteobacteria bacterium]